MICTTYLAGCQLFNKSADVDQLNEHSESPGGIIVVKMESSLLTYSSVNRRIEAIDNRLHEQIPVINTLAVLAQNDDLAIAYFFVEKNIDRSVGIIVSNAVRILKGWKIHVEKQSQLSAEKSSTALPSAFALFSPAQNWEEKNTSIQIYKNQLQEENTFDTTELLNAPSSKRGKSMFFYADQSHTALLLAAEENQPVESIFFENNKQLQNILVLRLGEKNRDIGQFWRIR